MQFSNRTLLSIFRPYHLLSRTLITRHKGIFSPGMPEECSDFLREHDTLNLCRLIQVQSRHTVGQSYDS